MVYERYVLKNGKLHGPYYYESYRDKYGNVQKKYLGSGYSLDKSTKHLYFLFFAICCMIVVVLFALFFYNGLAIEKVVSKIGEIGRGFTGFVIGGGQRSIQETQISACRNLSSANTIYQLTANAVSNDTCFKIIADNVTLDCQGYFINYSVDVGEGIGINISNINAVVKRCSIYAGSNNPNSHGISLGVSGANISDVFIKTYGSSSYGVYFNYAHYSNLTNVSIETTGTSASGLYYNFGENNSFRNGKIDVADSASYGVYIMTVMGESIINSNITMSGGGIAVYVFSSSSNTITGNSISSIGGATDAIPISAESNYNVIDNNTIYSAGGDGIDVSSVGPNIPTLNNISGNTFNSGSITGFDILVSSDDVAGGTWLIDQIGKTNDYSFSGASLIVMESAFGRVNWGMSIYEIGGNLSRNITLTNNSVIVNSVNTVGLNQSANVTFFNFGDRGYTDPGILRDGVACSVCYNFTSLTANNVIFNVTGWSNYSIGGGVVAGQLTSCGNLSSANTSYTLLNDVSASGTCFTVGGENINFNCAGKKILYSVNGQGYGFYNFYQYRNFSVRNCIIEQVNSSQSSDAILLSYSGNNTIYNNTIVINGSGRGIWLDYTSNANVSNNRINSTTSSSTGEGIYISRGSSNVIKDNLFSLVDGNAISLFGNSDYNVIESNTIKSNWSGVYLASGGEPTEYPNLNNVSGNIFKRGVTGNYDIYISSDCSSGGYDGTWLIDQIGNTNNYYISSSCLVVKDNTYGMIKWHNSIVAASGTNLSLEITITNNSAIVNGSNINFNPAANVTFFNIGNRNYSNIGVLKNGVNCLDCYNFSALTANTIMFNVTGWSNYSIGEWDASPPRVTIHAPRNVTYLTRNINFSVELNENGSVEFNMDGLNWNYSMDNPSSNNRNFSYLYLGLSNGAHTIRIYANDSFNNKNQTENVTFNVNVGEEVSSGATGGAGSLALPPGVLPPYMLICVPQFLCIPTGACVNGFRTKECVDVACGGSSYGTLEACNVELCVPEWQCSDWSKCENGRSKRECKDVNNCANVGEKPNLEVECIVKKEIEKEEVVKIECVPEFVCGEWGSCAYTSSAGDVLKGEVELLGKQERVCYDSKGCVESYSEFQSCVSKKVFEVKKEEVEVEGARGGRVVVVNPETKKSVVQIALESWKKKGVLDIKFVQ